MKKLKYKYNLNKAGTTQNLEFNITIGLPLKCLIIFLSINKYFKNKLIRRVNYAE
jgi:hypothetical protein